MSKPVILDHRGNEIKRPSCGFVEPTDKPSGKVIIDTSECWRRDPTGRDKT